MSPPVEPDDVDGSRGRGSRRSRRSTSPRFAIEPGPVVDDVDVRAPALDQLCVPQRGRVAPPADDDGVRRHAQRATRSSHCSAPVSRLRSTSAHRRAGTSTAVGISTPRRARRTTATDRVERLATSLVARQRCARRSVATRRAASIASQVQTMSSGHEVVALDVGVVVGRGEEARDDEREPRQQRVPRPHASRSPGDRAGAASASGPKARADRPIRSASLPGRSPNGSMTLPRNCCARTMYQNPSHVSGWP